MDQLTLSTGRIIPDKVDSALEKTATNTIPANLVLDELATVILDAYQFDADHLYEFSYRDRTDWSYMSILPIEIFLLDPI